MSVESSSTDRKGAVALRDRILAERHRRMVDSAGRRLASELYTYGCPAPRTELARRCGVDHWSQASLDEAVQAAERDGLIRSLPMGWIAPVNSFGAAPRPTKDRNRRAPLDRKRLPKVGRGGRSTIGPFKFS